MKVQFQKKVAPGSSSELLYATHKLFPDKPELHLSGFQAGVSKEVHSASYLESQSGRPGSGPPGQAALALVCINSPNVLMELSIPDGWPWISRSAWYPHLLIRSLSLLDHPLPGPDHTPHALSREGRGSGSSPQEVPTSEGESCPIVWV